MFLLYLVVKVDEVVSVFLESELTSNWICGVIPQIYCTKHNFATKMEKMLDATNGWVYNHKFSHLHFFNGDQTPSYFKLHAIVVKHATMPIVLSWWSDYTMVFLYTGLKDSLSPTFSRFLLNINAYPCGLYVRGQMDIFLRKQSQEKQQAQGQRRMQVRDNSQLPVKRDEGPSMFYI